MLLSLVFLLCFYSLSVMAVKYDGNNSNSEIEFMNPSNGDPVDSFSVNKDVLNISYTSSGIDTDIPNISSSLYFRTKIDECWKSAKCERLEVKSCFGVPLPYSFTSLTLSNLPSQRAAKDIMDSLWSLRHLPHCWSVVQPYICAVLFPKCNDSSVQIPSIEMCSITRGPCRLFEKERGWPDFLKCREDIPPKCKTASREMAFNVTGECAAPLINTSDESHWVEGIRGCGLQCADPLLRPDERKDLKAYVNILAGICLGTSALTVLTFLIDWRSAARYPALIVFYINACFVVASVGFVVQFYGDVLDRATCAADGTLRSSEPSSGGNLTCVTIFVCIYYFMIAACMWYVVLGYAWYKSFKSLAAGQCQQSLERKASYFHLFSWSIPLMFTIGVLASSGVEADAAVGICFLSTSVSVQTGALLLPVSAALAVGSGFLVAGLKSLLKMKLECSNIISERANKKLVENIIRLGIFVAALTAFWVIAVYTRIYIFLNQGRWQRALRKFILCTSFITSNEGSCSLSSRPDVSTLKLGLLPLFGSGVLLSSWCWTASTVRAWQRFLRRIVGVTSDEPARLAKHKVIAEAFAKRNDLNRAGRLSISIRSAHSDPIGLNFEMNSATSCDASSVWAAAIPHLMARRGAVAGSAAFAPRRESIDSEASVDRRFSLEYSLQRGGHRRRHSLDSQLSLHVSDVERFSAMQTARRFAGAGTGGVARMRSRREWFSLRKGRHRRAKGSLDRRNSTSDDSHFGSMVLPTLNLSTTDSLFTSMMKRLNLSSDNSQSSCLPQNSAMPNQATDSADEELVQNQPFSRKFNGFKRREREGTLESFFINEVKSKDTSHKSTFATMKASVGVQTSLESLGGQKPQTREIGCQANSPHIRHSLKPSVRHTASNTPASSSLCDSITSSSEPVPLKVDKYTQAEREKLKNIQNRRSLSPLASEKPAKKSSAVGSSKKTRKRRSQSENETNYIINVQ